MQIENLLLEHFRNYENQNVAFHPSYNVIYGENAQGKTNLLEAMILLSCGKSPRAKNDREMIAFDAEESRIKGKILAREREFSVEMNLFRGRRRRILVNQVPTKNAAELAGVLATVFFRPEDLFLIRDGAAARRKFMDGCLCQLRPRYAAALASYARLYEHKTRILRDAAERPDLRATLPDFNEQMARAGALVVHYRATFVEKLAGYAAQAHADCSGGRESLTLRYETVKTIRDPFAPPAVLYEQLLEHQKMHERAEIDARLCLSGPHKDDLLAQIGGRDAKAFSSQGQTRTAALALKIAEREIFKNALGEYPVLLLDDVLSELDPRRQEFVLNRISGGQVFISCCEEERLPGFSGGEMFHVKQGRILQR